MTSVKCFFSAVSSFSCFQDKAAMSVPRIATRIRHFKSNLFPASGAGANIPTTAITSDNTMTSQGIHMPPDYHQRNSVIGPVLVDAYLTNKTLGHYPHETM